MSYWRVQKESDGSLYTVWSLVMVRKLVIPAQGINSDDVDLKWKKKKIYYILSC